MSNENGRNAFGISDATTHYTQRYRKFCRYIDSHGFWGLLFNFRSWYKSNNAFLLAKY